jgi:hypothetical protein
MITVSRFQRQSVVRAKSIASVDAAIENGSPSD